MKPVNLEIFRFDYGLTFCVLLMNGDGTIYHTFGGRTQKDAEGYLSIPALVATMERTLKDHDAYEQNAQRPKFGKKRTVVDLPTGARLKQQNCVHCHTVEETMLDSLRARKKFTRRDWWQWPDPVEVGLELKDRPQAVVGVVAAKSAAASAGLQAGDRLVKVGATAIATFGDVQRALHDAP